VSTLRDLLTAPETRWIPGLAAAILVSLAAARIGALTASGTIAASLVGASMIAFGGWWAGIVLVTFFVSASALSKSSRRGAESQARGSRRDAVQVLANGGLATALALISALAGNPGPWVAASLGAIAGATADTWGTETGKRNRSSPRLVTTWRPVPPGTSGAVSLTGTIGSALGALLIGGASALGCQAGWSAPGIAAWETLLVITVAGFAGSIADSLLGATVQVRYRCTGCGGTTERRVHSCGSPTVRDRGWPWMNNDTVNVLAIAAAAAIAFIAARALA